MKSSHGRWCEEIGIKRYSPPCITARRGGCVIKRYREATKTDTAGVVFLFLLIGKPPRSRGQRMLRDIFLKRSTTPPCGDAKRGILLDSDLFTPFWGEPGMTGTRVLVTGATGFLGKALVPRLVGCGYQVTEVSRHSTPIAADLSNAAATAALQPWRWDIVVNLAGPGPGHAGATEDGWNTIAAHTNIALNV